MKPNIVTAGSHRSLEPGRGQAWPPVTGLLAGLALCLGLSACAAAAPADGVSAKAASSPPAAAQSAADLLSAIRSEIGRPACTADSQCRSLAVGHKACGGPETHLAWSTVVSNPTRLLALAARQAEARRKEVEARGLMSNCQVLADPGAVCRQGLCVPGDGPAAAAGGGTLQVR